MNKNRTPRKKNLTGLHFIPLGNLIKDRRRREKYVRQKHIFRNPRFEDSPGFMHVYGLVPSRSGKTLTCTSFENPRT